MHPVVMECDMCALMLELLKNVCIFVLKYVIQLRITYTMAKISRARRLEMCVPPAIGLIYIIYNTALIMKVRKIIYFHQFLLSDFKVNYPIKLGKCIFKRFWWLRMRASMLNL